jgi:transposase
MEPAAERVVLGMDPHKRSATVEVMTADETVVGGGRFTTDRDGYAQMLRYAKQWPDRVWAIEGCAGIGRHIAHRLLADGEEVVDVPPKLSARARVFATGQPPLDIEGSQIRMCRRLMANADVEAPR